MKPSISEQQLQQQVATLPTEIEPQRDLWLGIEKAINHPSVPNSNRRNSYQPTLTWAAAIILAIFSSWYVWSPNPTASTPSIAQIMRQTFEQQKQGLLTSYGQANTQLLPNLMQQQLKELESAQHTILNALKTQPQNADLLNLLRFTQQQELKLLAQLYQPTWQKI